MVTSAEALTLTGSTVGRGGGSWTRKNQPRTTLECKTIRKKRHAEAESTGVNDPDQSRSLRISNTPLVITPTRMVVKRIRPGLRESHKGWFRSDAMDTQPLSGMVAGRRHGVEVIGSWECF